MKISIEKADLDKLVLEAFTEGSLIDDRLWKSRSEELKTRFQEKITNSFFEESNVIKKLKEIK